MDITTVTIEHLNHFAKIREIFEGHGLEVRTIHGDLTNAEATFGKYDICTRSNATGKLKMYKINLYGDAVPEEGMYY